MFANEGGREGERENHPNRKKPIFSIFSHRGHRAQTQSPPSQSPKISADCSSNCIPPWPLCLSSVTSVTKIDGFILDSHFLLPAFPLPAFPVRLSTSKFLSE